MAGRVVGAGAYDERGIVGAKPASVLGMIPLGLSLMGLAGAVFGRRAGRCCAYTVKLQRNQPQAG